MHDKNFIKISGLFVNFYTKSGVVKAIDGVDLEINQGETLGLVGESGCGKSVTANSIMRLVPSPPGKIENGRILIDLPVDLHQRLVDIEKEEHLGADPSVVKKKLDEIAPDLDKYDVLKKSKYQMRKIRGKQISMIFQEPMSALNPVFTIGFQLTEILYLHEMPDLIKGALLRLEEARTKTKNSAPVESALPELEEPKCAVCSSPLTSSHRRCPYCGSDLHKVNRNGFALWNMKREEKALMDMSKDPESVKLMFMNRIPFLNSYKKRLENEALGKAVRMLRLVRIPDPGNIIKNYPHELSGGMQQRVMIAMALACKPRLLIADEPTTALDVTIQAQILKLMRELQEEMGTTILMITHNLGVVAEVCERIGVMYAGNIVEIGATDDIFAEPLHPYTQGLINSIPSVTSNVDRLEVITGSVPNLLHPPSGCRFHPRCPFAMPICSVEKPLLEDIQENHRVACHLYGKVNNNE
ncbi:MAG TPA: ABC transporter ATP-binding protein [Methanomassiliicoccales archaeon]|nr:ABC transporter ATP-binding protein [Methanomassiliicoccales archaeon]HPR97940.1 ABC transporter ATP-binding protein [Methanomassiliicoccales archaeon]